MTIIRALHDPQHPYFLVTRGVAQNHELSYEALGLLMFLLSKPDDWKIVPETLCRVGCGKNRVYKLLNELRDAGYIVQERTEAAHDKPPVWGERVVHEQPNPTTRDTAPNPTIHNPVSPDMANARYGENADTNQEIKDNQKEKELNTNAPVPAPARTRKAFEDVPKQDRLEIIRAWASNLPISPVNVYGRDAYHQAAADIFNAGYRATQVGMFVKAKMSEPFWIGKTLSLEKVGELMPLWLLSQSNGHSASPPPVQVEKRTRDPALAGFDANAAIDQRERDGTNDKGWIPDDLRLDFSGVNDAQKPATANS